MNLVGASLRNPHLVLVGALALVVLGGTAWVGIPTDLLPRFDTPAIQIVTLYPGMPPEVVEKDITSRLERWTGQSVGIEHQEARSMLGVSIVKDFFREDIDPASAMSQVTSLAVSDMFYLPPGTLPPMVMPFDPTAAVPLCLLSVASPTMSEKELYDVAYFEMRNRLQSIQGVIAPAVYGGQLRRILAYVDRDKLASRDLAPMDVVRSLRTSNVFVPTGNARLGDTDYLVLSNAMVGKVAELDDMVLRNDEEGPVFMRDVGKVEDTHQIQSNIVRINGRRQVYIPIYRQPGANTLAIVDAVRAKSTQILQRIREANPKAKDLRMDVVMDQSVSVRDAIRGLGQSALLGGIFVALLVLLFLGSVRSSVIIVTAIPLALLGGLVTLQATGSTLNSMTLGGLALAIGMLIDQAIVVVENTTRHLRMGKAPMRAALDGAREVALPILVSTVTLVVTFYPVTFLTGMAGFLFRPLALAVTAAAVTSFVLAMTLVPVACAWLLRPVAVGATAGQPSRFDRFKDSYGRLVGRLQRGRWLVAGVAAILLAGALVVGRGLGTELFPPVDAGQFTVLMRAPVGTRLERTEAIVKDVEAAIAESIGAIDPEGTDPSSDLALLISNIGVLYDWPAAYTPNTGPMDAFLLVQLKDTRKLSAQAHADKLRASLHERFPGVEFAFDTGGMLTAALNMGQPAPIDFKVQGSDLRILHEIAQGIATQARAIEGAVDVRVAQPLDYPALRFEVDRVKAAYLGVTQEEIVKNVVTALNSSVNFQPAFWIDPRNGNHYFIGAQYREEAIDSMATLEDIPIATGGRVIRLADVARIERTTSPAVVDHRNITRTVDVYADVRGAASGDVAAAIEARLATAPAFRKLMAEYEPRGYRYELYGEIASMRASFAQFAAGLGIAALLVYLVMVAQFRSFLVPLATMLAVPLGLVGVFGVLWLTGTNLGIPAFMGLILMVGMVVQYSVLLVDFAVRRQREGADAHTAARDAARERIRPVLMTASTTALALLPMAIGIGRGAEANAPLARAMLGAVLGGCALTLLVLPALYTFFGARLRPQADIPLDGEPS